MSNTPVISKVDGNDGTGVPTGTTDGAMMRYETTGSTWGETTAIIVDDSGNIGVSATPGGTFANGKAIAIGDSDTGIRQNGDGILELWANNQNIVDIITTGITVTGTVIADEVQAAVNDCRIGSDGIYFEDDKHAITFNDGFGNFNIRVANTGLADENCTEAGYITVLQYTQSTGVWNWDVSSASLALDATPTWRPQLTLGPSTVALAYQGSNKIITSSAGVTVTGTLTETSSARYKSNIVPLTDCLTNVIRLRGVTYDRNDNSQTNEPGLIAEEVYEVIPELVTFNDDGEIDGLNYTKLSAYLVESVKTLHAKTEQINNLAERLEKLEKLING